MSGMYLLSIFLLTTSHANSASFNSAVKLGQREGGSSQVTLTQRPAGKSRYEIERERALAPEVRNNNRARPVGLPASYTIAPKSTYIPGQAPTDHRPIGHSGHEAFRKMTQKGKGKR